MYYAHSYVEECIEKSFVFTDSDSYFFLTMELVNLEITFLLNRVVGREIYRVAKEINFLPIIFWGNAGEASKRVPGKKSVYY